jgi:hypothetical protein
MDGWQEGKYRQKKDYFLFTVASAVRKYILRVNMSFIKDESDIFI